LVILPSGLAFKSQPTQALLPDMTHDAELTLFNLETLLAIACAFVLSVEGFVVAPGVGVGAVVFGIVVFGVILFGVVPFGVVPFGVVLFGVVGVGAGLLEGVQAAANKVTVQIKTIIVITANNLFTLSDHILFINLPPIILNS
jgi:hypothetical protein